MNNNFMNNLSAIQSQLNQLQAMATQFPLAGNSLGSHNIEALVNEAINKRIESLMPQANKLNGLLIKIGSYLSEEDQKIINENLNSFPDFLDTPEGKEVIMLTVDSFKKSLTK